MPPLRPVIRFGEIPIDNAGDPRLRRDVAVYCPADADQRETLERTVADATEHAGPSMATTYGAWLDAAPVPHVTAQFANRGTLAKRIAERHEQDRRRASLR
jgi:hypothetical protein